MDDIGLLRDVSLSLDADWRPLDGFCRLVVAGQVATTSWFVVEPDEVMVESVTATAGRHSQRIPTGSSLAYLGLHPLQGDALITQARGSDPADTLTVIDGVTNSISPDGDQGHVAVPVRIEVKFVGDDEVTVPAGRFAARRFALRWHPDWPAADLWVRRHDCVFLRLEWSLTGNSYELTSIEER